MNVLKSFAGGSLFGVRVGTAPPEVLALHGWRRSHRDFDSILEGLNAIAIDLPGFGSSPEPLKAFGAADYARAVEPVLDEFDRPPVVLGHSLGGRVAVSLAAELPHRIRALVLTGAPLIRLARKGRRPAWTYRLARRLNKLGLLTESRMEELRQRYGSTDYRASSGVMRQTLVKVVNESYESQLGRIKCPVELVWGDRDLEVPLQVAEAGRALLENAALTVVPGADHFTPQSAVPDIRAALRRQLG